VAGIVGSSFWNHAEECRRRAKTDPAEDHGLGDSG
jgi:hypothetical protein